MFIYPWTNFHELNLDWILATLKKLVEQGKIAPEAATEIPLADNVNPAAGETIKYAREDHKHPAYYVTPQMFGAAGDGIKDDTTAIQAAFDNEKRYNVFFPAGTYKISRKLVLPRSNKVSVQLDNATIIATASMDAVIEVSTENANNYPSQTITGSGVIDCNYLAERGIQLHNNAAYFQISKIQIRNVKNIGIQVGDDTSRSLGVYICDTVVVGNTNVLDTIGIKMVSNDCYLDHILVLRCGIGIESNGCNMTNIHIWAEQNSAERYAATIGIKLLSNYSRLSNLYLDAVGTGILMDSDCNANISDLLYMTDYTSEPQTLYMIKAHPICNINVDGWSVVPRTNVVYVPLKYTAFINYYQFATHNLKGESSSDVRANIDPRNELCNIARNAYFHSLTKYFGPYSGATNYLIGYIKQANNTSVNLDITIGAYSCTLEINAGNTPTLRGSSKRFGNALSGNILLGAAEVGPGGDNFYPVYLVPDNNLSTYTFITFDCHGDCGNSGFYPLTKENTTDVVTVASVNPVLTIPLPA